MHRLKSRAFKDRLQLFYFDAKKSVANDNSLGSALGVLGAIARYRGKQRKAFVRRAFFDGKLYIDLCDDRWRVIEVSQEEWRILEESLVLFVRYPGMSPLPIPERGDPQQGIALLRKLMRTRTHGDFVIIVVFMLDALGGRGPHAVLFFTGESGSTKTTHGRIVRDPNTRPERYRPKEVRDVFAAAIRSGMIFFNNLSSMPEWLSDVLCIVTEGGSDSRRVLFTDDDESVVSACVPVILAAIANITTKGDLGARTLYAALTPVPDDKRRTNIDLWKEVDEAAGKSWALCSLA